MISDFLELARLVSSRKCSDIVAVLVRHDDDYTQMREDYMRSYPRTHKIYLLVMGYHSHLSQVQSRIPWQLCMNWSSVREIQWRHFFLSSKPTMPSTTSPLERVARAIAPESATTTRQKIEALSAFNSVLHGRLFTLSLVETILTNGWNG